MGSISGGNSLNLLLQVGCRYDENYGSHAEIERIQKLRKWFCKIEHEVLNNWRVQTDWNFRELHRQGCSRLCSISLSRYSVMNLSRDSICIMSFDTDNCVERSTVQYEAKLKAVNFFYLSNFNISLNKAYMKMSKRDSLGDIL